MTYRQSLCDAKAMNCWVDESEPMNQCVRSTNEPIESICGKKKCSCKTLGWKFKTCSGTWSIRLGFIVRSSIHLKTSVFVHVFSCFLTFPKLSHVFHFVLLLNCLKLKISKQFWQKDTPIQNPPKSRLYITFGEVSRWTNESVSQGSKESKSGWWVDESTHHRTDEWFVS